jgi:hypothetical protein
MATAPRIVILALLVGFVAVAYVVVRVRSEAGKGMPDSSVYSNAHDGLATAATVLRKLGWQPVAVTRPIQQTHHRGLLILVEPHTSAGLLGMQPGLSEGNARGLLDWVARGNTLLLCGRQPTELHDVLGVGLKADPDAAHEEGVHVAEPAEVGGYTDRIDRLAVERLDSVRPGPGVPLWWVDGQPGAVLARHGSGRVLVVPDPSLLTHRGLLRQDNALFLYDVAALDAVDGRVYFDEYHHGLRSGGGVWGYLRYHDQQWSLVQLLLVALVGVWMVGVRLGPAVPVPKERRADAVDYASGVARIYQRAGVRHVLARGLVRDFLAALTRHLRLRPTALPVQILAAWGKRHPEESARHLEYLLRGTVELRRFAARTADMSEHQLWTWAKAFDEFAQASSFSREPRASAGLAAGSRSSDDRQDKEVSRAG